MNHIEEIINCYHCIFQIDNYFVAVGMNGNSLQGAGGAGQAIAEWIMYGSLSKEMLPFDVRRFVDLHNNRRYLKERTREVVGRLVIHKDVFISFLKQFCVTMFGNKKTF